MNYKNKKKSKSFKKKYFYIYHYIIRPENILSKEGNLIFPKKEQDQNENNELEKLASPAVSTKTVLSQRASNFRQESASEGESIHRRKHG